MSIEVGQYLGQDGVWLKNDHTRLFVQKFGGMTPEFSCRNEEKTGNQWVNTHWNPHFRAPFSGKLSQEVAEQREYWGIELMRQAAGTFPCAPTFGPGNDTLLPHGDLANSDWHLEQATSTQGANGLADYALWTLNGGYEDLQYRKWDCLYRAQSAHYMVMEVTNSQPYPVPVNLAWHTTLGAPFLERGCLISSNCNQFSTPPEGTEFDHTASLVKGAAFNQLSCAPNQKGDTTDISSMPGYNGHSEFVTGTTEESEFLWSVCVNPFLDIAYLSLIPLNVLDNQANASFMNYWMHSGGRDFLPWADCVGGVDRTYALGMESSIGASCLGLDWSKENASYMDRPSHLVLQPNQNVSFPCINSLFSMQLVGTDRNKIEQQIKDNVKKHIATLDVNFTAFKAQQNNDN